MSFEEVTRKYVREEDGKEIEVTGQDIEQFPDPKEHDFYQEGSYICCTCHPHTTKRVPAGMQLVLKGGSLAFEKIQVS